VSSVISAGLRRLWRLLPVMWISILFAAPVALLPRGESFAGATAWFGQFSSVATSPAILLQNLLGLSHSINSVLWSIQIELGDDRAVAAVGMAERVLIYSATPSWRALPGGD
jgi:peptidoglycan/LPS O-acetylase OafA/YrhL